MSQVVFILSVNAVVYFQALRSFSLVYLCMKKNDGHIKESLISILRVLLTIINTREETRNSTSLLYASVNHCQVAVYISLCKTHNICNESFEGI